MNLCVHYCIVDSGDDGFMRWMGLGSGRGEMMGCVWWMPPVRGLFSAVLVNSFLPDFWILPWRVL